MEQPEVKVLADKLDQLLERYGKLELENQALKGRQENWIRERAQLVHKNDLAKTKLEAMIGRLRALEQH